MCPIASSTGSTPLSAVVAQAEDSARVALEREVVRGWEEFRTPEGMHYEQRVVTMTARQ